MKKTLSFLLVLAMVLSSFTFAFAADQVKPNAEVKTHTPYIVGKDDGTFAPKDSITKEEVATMLARALDLKAATPKFEDADKIGGWAKDYVGALQEAGIVQGNDKGCFEPKKEVTRAELATMLVNAYEGEIEVGENSFKDVPAKAWYADAVKKAASAGFVKGVGNDKFNPNNPATREQTVVMVNRMLGLEDVVGADKLETELKDVEEWSDWAKDAILVASTQFSYEVVDGEVVIVDEDEEVVDKEALEAKVAEVAELVEEDYTEETWEALQTAVKAAEAVVADEEATQEEVDAALADLVDAIEALEEAEVELEVVEVSAITPTSVKVEFNKEIEELAKSDIEVRNVKTSAKQYVKEVELAEDKLSAEVVFYDALESKNTYVLKIGDLAKEFDFVKGEVAKVVADVNQKLAPENNKVDLNDLEYKVLDTEGLDVTEEVTVSFESTVEPDADNKIVLAEGKSAFVYIKVDGTKVKSNRIKVTAEEPKVTEIVDYTIVDSDKTAKKVFEDEEYKQVTQLKKSDKNKFIIVQAKDQYGDFVYSGATFESLDKDVALVDRTKGTITPLKEGVAPVRITVGDVTKTVEIEVLKDSEAAAIEISLKDEEIEELEITNKAGKEVALQLKDQYDKDLSERTLAKVTTDSKALDLVEDITFVNGKATLEIKPAKDAKAGEAVVTIALNDEVKAELKVTIVEAGEVDSYEVVGFEKELDKYAGKDEENITEMTIGVNELDEAGNVIGKLKSNDFKVVVKDEKGNEVTITDKTIDAANLVKDKEYTVTVTVGTVEIFKDTFKVVDTEVVDEKVVEVNKPVNIAIYDNDEGDLEAEVIKSLAINGTPVSEMTEGDANKPTGIKFASSDNTKVISINNGKATVNKQGSATLVISEITFDINDTNDSKEYTKLETPLNINVTIEAMKGNADVTASIAEINSQAADDILTNPFGGVTVKFSLKETEKTIKDLESLSITLLDENDKVLSTNTLKDSAKNELPDSTTTIDTTFNFGRGEEGFPLTATAWNWGDFDRDAKVKKVVAEYKLNDKVYRAESTALDLSAPEGYDEQDVELARKIVKLFSKADVVEKVEGEDNASKYKLNDEAKVKLDELLPKGYTAEENLEDHASIGYKLTIKNGGNTAFIVVLR